MAAGGRRGREAVAKPDTRRRHAGDALAPRLVRAGVAYTTAADRAGHGDDGGADRCRSMGASPLDVTSTVTTAFSASARLVKSVTSELWASSITSVTHDADGLPCCKRVYGDVASTTTHDDATTVRRPISAPSSNLPGPPRAVVGQPVTLIMPAAGVLRLAGQHAPDELENLTYHYDEVDNPARHRWTGALPSEWPAGAQPVRRTMAVRRPLSADADRLQYQQRPTRGRRRSRRRMRGSTRTRSGRCRARR